MENDNVWMAKVIEHACAILKKGWCKEFCAVDKKGRPIRFDSDTAVAFSLPCAIFRAEHDLSLPFQRRGKTIVALSGDLMRRNSEAANVEELIFFCEEAIRRMRKTARDNQKKPRETEE